VREVGARHVGRLHVVPMPHERDEEARLGHRPMLAAQP